LLLIYDGVCNFCNFWVRFVVKRDKKKKFQFSPYQSVYAKRFFAEQLNDYKTNCPESVIIIENGKVFTNASAIIKILNNMPYPWRFFSFILNILPIATTDYLYRLIAKNRYRLFGRKDNCKIPPKRFINRFLID
jgi:predicted DCC family thiol-disulfide oxidoreductase YuxK